MDARKAALALALLLSVAPSAAAEWAVKGASEPDTAHDTSIWMHADPDVSPVGQSLYFNGFGALGTPALTTANPNVATISTRVHATPFLPVAMMGLWKDCNGDGYVGWGDQGLLEYRAELLLDDSICPAVLSQPTFPWTVHNDGTWVVELMPWGYDDITTPEDENALNVNDTRARVWADWGLPGEAPALTCAAAPVPYGTLRSTGGALRWIDCYNGFRGVAAASDAFVAAGFDEFSFHDAPRDRPDLSESTLNQPNPWGTEGDAPMATVFDCSNVETVEVLDPTGGELRDVATVPMPDGSELVIHGTDEQGRVVNATVPAVSPTLNTGTPAGTVNETQAAVTDCDRTNSGEVVDLDGSPAGSDAELPYAIEGDSETITPYAPRTRTDHAFTFEEGVRDSGLPALGVRMRDDAGLGAASVVGFWVGTGAALGGPDPYLSRNELGARGVSTITYYGFVEPQIIFQHGFRMPSDALAFYGAETCGGFTPVFECDEEKWWRNAAGEDVTPRDSRLGEDPDDPTVPAASDDTKIGVRVGQRYQMRDVDCVDTSASPLRESGVHWGALTSTSCA